MKGIGDLWLKGIRIDLKKITQGGGEIQGILSHGNYYAETKTKSESMWIFSKYLKHCPILGR